MGRDHDRTGTEFHDSNPQYLPWVRPVTNPPGRVPRPFALPSPLYMKPSPRLLALATLLLGTLPAEAAVAQTRRPAQPAAAVDTAREARLARADRNRIRGAENGIWIVVISDYQCPFCKKWHDETESRIEREYVRTGKVRIAYMNFPITSIHPNAMPAHEVAMCAAEQDRFWPVSDALFRTQESWKTRRDIRGFLDSLVTTIPHDRARLQACLRSGEMRELIEADMDRSRNIGVGSTPSFLVGGRPVIGAQPYEAFKRAIDAALAAPPTP